MTQNIHELLQQYIYEVQNIYRKHLKNIILYGSYARGDFTQDSDVDIMILVDLPDNELESYSDALSELGFVCNVEHNIWMMPVVKNIDHFHYWSKAYPFYANVQKEGVVLYETA